MAGSDRALHGFLNPPAIQRADRITGSPQLGWVRGPEGEEVGNNQPTAAPSTSEPKTFSDSRVIAVSVRHGRVEHDEASRAIVRAYLTSQQVAVLAAI
jgi:hypothetical protein